MLNSGIVLVWSCKYSVYALLQVLEKRRHFIHRAVLGDKSFSIIFFQHGGLVAFCTYLSILYSQSSCHVVTWSARSGYMELVRFRYVFGHFIRHNVNLPNLIKLQLMATLLCFIILRILVNLPFIIKLLILVININGLTININITKLG